MGDDSSAAIEFRRLLRGSALVFVGNLIGIGSSFGTRVVAANHLGSADYGLVVLGITFVNLTSLVVLVGLPQGVARQIPRAERKTTVFYSSLLVALPLAILTAVLFIVFARSVSSFFDEPAFVPVLVAFSVTLPFFVFVKLAVGGMRGLENPHGRVLLQDVSGKGLLLVVVAVGSFLGVGVVGISISWTVTFAVTSVLAVYVISRHTTLRKPAAVSLGDVSGTGYSLVGFSLPLMFSGAAARLLSETDNLFLGFFRSSEAIGVYDAAFTLAQMMLVFLTGFAFLFLPAFSRLDDADDRETMDRFYKVAVKWLVFLTFPLFVSLVFYPGFFLSTLFGDEFVAGEVALVVVSVGTFASVLLGLNGNALMAVGRTRLILRANVFALAANVVLNAVLIPEFGIVGAAVATAVSYVVVDGYRSYYLYSLSGIHPFYASYVRPLIASTLAAIFVYSGTQAIPTTAVSVATFVTAVSLCHLLLIVFFGGLDSEDVELLETIDKRVAVDLKPIRRFVRKYAE